MMSQSSIARRYSTQCLLEHLLRDVIGILSQQLARIRLYTIDVTNVVGFCHHHLGWLNVAFAHGCCVCSTVVLQTIEPRVEKRFTGLRVDKMDSLSPPKEITGTRKMK